MQTEQISSLVAVVRGVEGDIYRIAIVFYAEVHGLMEWRGGCRFKMLAAS